MRRNATTENNRFAHLFRALAERGFVAEPAVYHDEFCDEVRQQLLGVRAVLVWVNPIEGGRDRARLDAMLREIVAAGIFVSAHPDVILKIGTKDVVFETRDFGWGSDTHRYASLEELRRELPGRLAARSARVLKQYRGHSGIGIWKVHWQRRPGDPDLPREDTLLHVRHAQRGCVEEEVTLGEFLERCAAYFSGSGRMIDQVYQERLTDGMIRCYLVHGKVAGFGHQAINALYPAPPGATNAPAPGPRFYHPPTMPEFQPLKRRLETEWVPALQRRFSINTASLPVLWDCDFLLGPKDADGQDTYVLCEINASSVAPFPDSAVPEIVEAIAARLQ